MASPPPPGGPYVDPSQQQYAQQPPYGQPDPYAQQQAPVDPSQQHGYAAVPASGPPAAGPPPAASHGGRGKKARGYAEQQYEFGAGANAGLTPGGSGTGPGAYQGVYPGAQMGGYPAPDQTQQQGQFVQPMGGPAAVPQQAGYPGAQPAYDPTGMGGVTQQFGQMGMGGQQGGAMAPQPQGSTKTQALNQLYPVDLMQQPFNVAELDMPPPEIILPPNVSFGEI